MNHRYDFVYLFDCKDGNPNGDPDAANSPRVDPQDMHGLVSDVCLKRKVRNFTMIAQADKSRFDIFIQTKTPLNPLIAAGARDAGLPDFQKADGKWDGDKAKARTQKDIRSIQEKLCHRYFDIRTFGGVLSTGPNAGQIRGPVQITFSRSVDPIMPLDLCITRVTDVDKEEGEMGRKNLIPYGLYRCHGFISANLAAQTSFSQTDLEHLFTALCGRGNDSASYGANMFMGDESSAHGTMAPQKLIVFQHGTPLGNAPAHKLFERVTVKRKEGVAVARDFSDYTTTIDRTALPAEVKILELL